MTTYTTATNTYGLVINKGNLDYSASVKKRKELSKISPAIKTYSWVGDSESTYRQCFMSTTTLRHLSLRVGDLIELYTQVGAPVRAWVISPKTKIRDGCYLEPDALHVLNIKDGGSSFWRLLHR